MLLVQMTTENNQSILASSRLSDQSCLDIASDSQYLMLWRVPAVFVACLVVLRRDRRSNSPGIGREGVKTSAVTVQGLARVAR